MQKSFKAGITALRAAIIASLASAAMMLAPAPAMAHGGDQGAAVGGSITVGGALTGYQGAVNGQAGSTSTGSVAVSSQVAGPGQSHVDGNSSVGGNASVGGVVSQAGVQVGTQTNQWGSSNLTVNMSGNAVATDGTTIINGGQAVGSANNVANGVGTFQIGTIGAVGTIGGVVAVGAIHN